jgi:hypothetical protein
MDGRQGECSVGQQIEEWQQGWKPTPGDRAQVINGSGSGTIVEVDGQRVRLRYDLAATGARPKRSEIVTGEETGWHDRKDLEPIDDAARRVIKGR